MLQLHALHQQEPSLRPLIEHSLGEAEAYPVLDSRYRLLQVARRTRDKNSSHSGDSLGGGAARPVLGGGRTESQMEAWAAREQPLPKIRQK